MLVHVSLLYNLILMLKIATGKLREIIVGVKKDHMLSMLVIGRLKF